MSDLTALQPTIFFASCTLKGIVWIPWYFWPELFISRDDDDDDDDPHLDELLGADPLLQDHHLLLIERICHYTNIFGLIGMITFYAVNPRLWQYRYYGYLLLALLLLQHLPQQIIHDGWFTLSSTTQPATPRHPSIAEDDIFEPEVEEDSTTTATTTTVTTGLDILNTNRIFSTIGVLIIQSYCLYFGHLDTLHRFTAEPLFVYTTLITILMETHIVFVCVWLLPLIYGDGKHYHVSSALHILARQVVCFLLTTVLIAAAIYQRQVHKRQAKILRKQLKTIDTKHPKMKFV